MKFVPLIVTLLLIAVPVPVSVAEAPEVLVFHVRGDVVAASFQSVDPSGCVLTRVFVDADVVESQTPAGRPESEQHGGIGFIQRFDSCRGLVLVQVCGKTSSVDLQIRRDLGSARLTGTMSMGPCLEGVVEQEFERPFEALVDLTWAGTGDLERDVETSGFVLVGDTVFTRHLNGTFRPGQASGTVFDGTINFTPEPSISGQIASVNAGRVVVTFPPN